MRTRELTSMRTRFNSMHRVSVLSDPSRVQIEANSDRRQRYTVPPTKQCHVTCGKVVCSGGQLEVLEYDIYCILKLGKL